MRKMMKRSKAERSYPLTLAELHEFANRHHACSDGLMFVTDLLERHGERAPAKVAWDECEDGSWISWLADEAASSAGRGSDESHQRQSNQWSSGSEATGAYARKCFEWDDVEANIWVGHKIRRPRPPPPATLESRIELLEAEVALLKAGRRKPRVGRGLGKVLERGARRAR